MLFPKGPVLVLVISVNQLSANLFEVGPRFTAGMARLAQGIVYSSGYHTHALTEPVRTGSANIDTKEIAARVMMSPVLDELTAIGAAELIHQFDLGRGPDPDLLAVSFSGTDYIGHHFGTRGPEMCEQMYRLDAAIGRLLTDLDRRHVNYIAVLTADHGGSDFPERLSRLGYPRAQRLPEEDILGRVNRIVMSQLGLPNPPLSGSIDEQTLHVKGAGHEGVLDSVVKALRAQPDVAAAFTREELLSTPIHAGVAPEEVPLKERYAMSVFPERSADVLVALKPLVYPLDVPKSSKDYIETHGSPWDYDRRVPILFWWSGARSETRYIPAETVDIAPTLAALIGISAPQDLDGHCLPLEITQRSLCPGNPTTTVGRAADPRVTLSQ